MFGKLMSIPDAQMGTYYRLVLTRSKSWVERLESDIESGKVHPMDAKMDLAFDIVKEFHDRTAAENSQSRVPEGIQGKRAPTDIPEVFVQEGKRRQRNRLARLVCLTGLASSSQEERRLVRSGAVRVDGVRRKLSRL